MTVSITVAIPQVLVLTSNQRLHWATRRERVETIRHMAYLDWRKAGSPHLDAAVATVGIDYPNKSKRDIHNLMPSVKAAIDGLVAGPYKPGVRGGNLLPDDDDAHLTGPDLRPTGVVTPRYLTMHFTFTERNPS